jgi:tetratricopeptide (TPR) repeat protein
LRLRQQVTPTEIQQAGDDLYQWQNEIEQLDAELKAKENKKSSQQRGNVPPVRGTKREKLDASLQSSQQRSQSGGGAANQSDSRATQAQRLSGYDFQAWEKFDVDAAVNAIDDEEKVAEREKQVSRETGKKLAEELRLKRLQRYEDELSKIRSEMNTSNMTALQRKSLAGFFLPPPLLPSSPYLFLCLSVREKQKGNEAFKANELNEAFVFYSRSLALDDSIAAVHANRALVSIRLEKLETGEDDATRALALDPNHMKALSRRGLARFKLGKTALAIEDFQRALDLKPGNAELEQLLEKAKAKFLEVEGHEYGSSPVKLPPSSSSSSSDSSVVLTVKVVSSAKDLLLPSHSQSTGGGKLIRVDRSPSQKFTRIAIQESDEEGEEEQDQGGELTPSTTAAAAGSTASAGGGFTRIAIQLDSESDEEGDAEAEAEPTEEPKPEAKSSFTRIPISVVESDSEDEQAPSEAELEAQALSFKEQGNEFMKAEDYARALRSYSESLNLSPNGPHAIAALSNRSLAYLQLKVCFSPPLLIPLTPPPPPSAELHRGHHRHLCCVVSGS